MTSTLINFFNNSIFIDGTYKNGINIFKSLLDDEDKYFLIGLIIFLSHFDLSLNF